MVIIRRLQDTDVLALTRFFEWMDVPTTDKNVEKRIQRLLDHPDYRTWVAVEGEEIIGLIGCSIIEAYLTQRVSVQVHVLLVRSDDQKQEVEKWLLKRAEEWATKVGASHLFIPICNEQDGQIFLQEGYEYREIVFQKQLKK